MDYSELFHKSLISLQDEYSSQLEMFEDAFIKLQKEGYVENTFKEAVIEREKEYPTGLFTDNLNVAIPHTDVKHIKRPFIYLTTSASPIDFVQMGSENDLVEVNTIFILGIKDPGEQVGLLSKIMEKIQDREFVKKFNQCSTSVAMEKILKNTFGSEK